MTKRRDACSHFILLCHRLSQTLFPRCRCHPECVDQANPFVGDQSDFESIMPQLDGWAVVHPFKEPYHRQALGYTGRAAARNHPEYLVARRGLRLILNMVDVDNPAFFDMGMIC
jgi:hypothetical protein